MNKDDVCLDITQVVRQIKQSRQHCAREPPAKKLIFPYLETFRPTKPTSPLYSRPGLLPLHDHKQTVGPRSTTISQSFSPPHNRFGSVSSPKVTDYSDLVRATPANILQKPLFKPRMRPTARIKQRGGLRPIASKRSAAASVASSTFMVAKYLD